MKAILPLVFLMPILVGCGDSVNNAPPAAAMAPRNDPPTKIPTTVDEKIAAIERSPLPEDQKKKAIEQVKSSKL